jgi:hypothetical protein
MELGFGLRFPLCLPAAVLAETGGRLGFGLLRFSQIVLICEGASLKTHTPNPNFRPFAAFLPVEESINFISDFPGNFLLNF